MVFLGSSVNVFDINVWAIAWAIASSGNASNSLKSISIASLRDESESRSRMESAFLMALSVSDIDRGDLFSE